MLGKPRSIHELSDLVINPMVGWRAWRLIVSYGRPLLTSPDRDTVWIAGLNQAVCRHETQEQRLTCHCGFNAFATRERLMREHYAKLPVIGTVELTGEVQQYEEGYRGQYARVRELWISHEHAHQAAAITEIYGCPVHVAPAPAPAPAPRPAPPQSQPAPKPAILRVGVTVVQPDGSQPALTPDQWHAKVSDMLTECRQLVGTMRGARRDMLYHALYSLEQRAIGQLRQGAGSPDLDIDELQALDSRANDLLHQAMRDPNTPNVIVVARHV